MRGTPRGAASRTRKTPFGDTENPREQKMLKNHQGTQGTNMGHKSSHGVQNIPWGQNKPNHKKPPRSTKHIKGTKTVGCKGPQGVKEITMRHKGQRAKISPDKIQKSPSSDAEGCVLARKPKATQHKEYILVLMCVAPCIFVDNYNHKEYNKTITSQQNKI
jgi:hypothetical protein